MAREPDRKPDRRKANALLEDKLPLILGRWEGSQRDADLRGVWNIAPHHLGPLDASALPRRDRTPFNELGKLLKSAFAALRSGQRGERRGEPLRKAAEAFATLPAGEGERADKEAARLRWHLWHALRILPDPERCAVLAACREARLGYPIDDYDLCLAPRPAAPSMERAARHVERAQAALGRMKETVPTGRGGQAHGVAALLAARVVRLYRLHDMPIAFGENAMKEDENGRRQVRGDIAIFLRALFDALGVVGEDRATPPDVVRYLEGATASAEAAANLPIRGRKRMAAAKARRAAAIAAIREVLGDPEPEPEG